IGEFTPLPQPPQALHPAPWLAPAPLRLAPRIVARHANCYEAIQFGEDPAALAVPVVLTPANQILPQGRHPFAPAVAQPHRRTNDLAHAVTEPLPCFPTRPTQHTPRLPLLVQSERHAAVMKAEEVKTFLTVIHHPRLLR